MPNRLSEETSPYLLQHKDNPVEWWPWGDDAFEAAKRRDVPILLSVGYAACHWCHVMAHESFEDPAVARVMNRDFVCVKVDREERPDVDAVYMEAVQVMTGHGGWPMTVFLTPEGTPFFGGTYFPPEDRYGVPSFTKLLQAISDAWTSRRDDVERQAGELVNHIDVAASLTPSRGLVGSELLDEALDGIGRSFDRTYGGFGRAPKFPQPMTLDFLLRYAARDRSGAWEMVKTTLDAMASGGMFDQLAGGFARYSVDETWTVPHFEKMLYDNAQLLRTYTRAWQLRGEPLHREVAEATGAWMLAEMRDPGGGFWSALDADSEGEEGKFYVWTLDEVRDVAGPDADLAIEAWGFTEAGNFEGSNIPTRASEVADRDRVAQLRRRFLARRSERVRPQTDTKVLAGWNGLAASALAEAGATLGNSDWVRAASECLGFVLDTMRIDGRLMRSARSTGGKPIVKHLAYCEDYAMVLEAALALFEATSDPRWLAEARWAADAAIELFADRDNGGFFTTGTDAEALVVRPKDLFDNAIPSANSVLALELQRLAAITGNLSYEEQAVTTIRIVRDLIPRSPLGFGRLLEAIDFYVSGAVEIVIIRADDSSGVGLIAAAQRHLVPNKVLVVADPPSRELVGGPLLEGRDQGDGDAAAYVCRRGVCKLPVTQVDDLVHELERVT